MSVGIGTTGNFYKPSSTEISASLHSLSKPLRRRDLIGQDGHDPGVTAIEFSDDGSFFVSGDDDGRVSLWRTDRALARKWTIKATQMEAEQGIICCLAVSPDNNQILSGNDETLLIHDIKT